LRREEVTSAHKVTTQNNTKQISPMESFRAHAEKWRKAEW